MEYIKFKTSHPSYEHNGNVDYYYSQLPDGFISDAQGLIMKYVKGSAEHLKRICHNLAGMIPRAPTTNWGLDYLIIDLGDMMRVLAKKKVHCLMDFLAGFALTQEDDEAIEDLNDLLKEHKIGYQLTEGYDERKKGKYIIHGPHWEVIGFPRALVTEVEAAQEEVQDIHKQTSEHLEQVKKGLVGKSDRERKNALRDALSALESFLRKLTKAKDIKSAVAILAKNSAQKDKQILRDALGIWEITHQLYPDVRHGTEDNTVIPAEEIIYWINRIIAYIRYVTGVHKKDESK